MNMKLLKIAAVSIVSLCAINANAEIPASKSKAAPAQESAPNGLSVKGSATSAAQPTNQDTLAINQASAEEIAATLNGVGQVKAQAIVEFRETNGSFKSAEELTQVKGIGMATVTKNQALLNFN